MSKSTWTGAISSDWNDADNWSPVGVPGVNSDVTIATGDAVASASIGTVNSITDSSDLPFESAGTNTVATILDNSGSLHVDDNGGAGGTNLNIGGTLTNSGNSTLSASDKVTAASRLDLSARLQRQPDAPRLSSNCWKTHRHEQERSQSGTMLCGDSTKEFVIEAPPCRSNRYCAPPCYERRILPHKAFPRDRQGSATRLGRGSLGAGAPA